MTTPSNNPTNTPLIVAAVVAGCFLLYLFLRPDNSSTVRPGQPSPLPQGKAKQMASNPGKLVVLSNPRVTKLPQGSELGPGRTGWVVELSYVWKSETDKDLVFKAPYRMPKPKERGNYALPAGGTARPAQNGRAQSGKTSSPAANSASPPAAIEPTFLLPQRNGKVRLLIPNDPGMMTAKGDKITLSLQGQVDKWMIPASNEVALPPLP